jgi:hypothetical protein
MKRKFYNGNMVPFDRLDNSTRRLDRGCIAAMAACGFGEGGG